ncbi:MAG: energy-coupled thiamine transporter ThiT [Eubacteriales bacterium]|nr:energy-coupled thiamine transporter ThiT [Eubacteriales bacterium]
MKYSIRSLVEGALCIAIAFVLSYIKLWQMPLGGSVTLFSMLPLMLYANRYGWKAGVLAGLAYGMLQFIQKPEITHWVQVILDYPLAFAAIGLAGVTKQMQLGCIIGGLGRFVCHFLTGATFFAIYMPENFSNPWFYSLCYNGAYLGIDIALCVLASFPVCVILKKANLGGTPRAN